MPMFLCSFPDRSTIFLERADEKDAKRDATAAADGEVPTRVRRFVPNVFIAEVTFPDCEEGDDAELDDLELEPFPHIAELLFDLEPQDVDVAAIITGPTALVAGAAALCGDENLDGDDNPVRCVLAPHKSGDHESADGLVWK